MEGTPVLTPSRLLTNLSLSGLDDWDTILLPSPLRGVRNLTTFSLPATPVTQKTLPPATTPTQKRPLSSPATTPPQQKRQKGILGDPLPHQRTSSSGGANSNQPPSTPIQQAAASHTASRIVTYTSEDEDGGLNNEDPFASRPSFYAGGFYHRPMLKYFHIADTAVADEFELMLHKPISEYLQQHEYPQYSILCSNVGYEESTAVPCVLIIARQFDIHDATSVIELVDRLPRRLIKSAFCYQGSTSTHDSSHLKEHQTSPSVGSSFGAQNGSSSFSLGWYVQFKDDQSHYSVSVHHGVTATTASITPETTPAIHVQQPSNADHHDLIESFETTLRLIDEGAPAYRWRSRKLNEQWLKETQQQNTDFGIVRHSEYKVIGVDDRQINCDWCLIEVNSERNPLVNTFLHVTKDRTFLPRDKVGNIYIQGIEDLDVGSRVLKCGRSTGCTVGKIELIYAHAKQDEKLPETSEFTVVSGSQGRFSDFGDSGAPVMDEGNHLIGMVLGGMVGEPMILKGHEHLDKVFASYISPITVIMDRIEAVTGKEPTVIVTDIQKLRDEGVEFIGDDLLKQG